jgi:hypothetical protein
MNIMRLVFLFFGLVIGIILLVRSTLQTSVGQKNFISVYFRIFMNHFQLLTLTSSFDLKWPPQIRELFSFAKPISEATTQFLSFDCFLDLRKNNSDLEAPRTFFQKTIMLALAPILMVAISYLVWNLIFLYQRSKRQKEERMELLRPKAAASRYQLRTGFTIRDLDKKLQARIAEKMEVEHKNSSIICTLVIMLFLIHPTVTEMMFNSFK